MIFMLSESEEVGAVLDQDFQGDDEEHDKHHHKEVFYIILGPELAEARISSCSGCICALLRENFDLF